MKNYLIILLGPPGAGKGTHGASLSKALKLPHISTGDLFRENISKKTDLGISAKSFMEKGLLVPDEIVENMLLKRIEKKDCSKGLILDGFPRNIPQAETLFHYAKKKYTTVVIHFKIEKNLLLQRITGRLICKKCSFPYHKIFSPPKRPNICDHCSSLLYQRKDDSKEAVKIRLLEYEKKTQPLVKFYKEKNVCFDIDASKAKDEVYKQIEKIFL